MSDPQSTTTVQSDERLFAIVESVLAKGQAGVTDVANELGLAKSTVHKHLATLEQHEYAVRENGKYRISLKFLDYGIQQRSRFRLYHSASPKLHQLAEETEEMASCIVEEHGYGVFIDRVWGEHSVHTKSRLGSRMHLHCHSGGKAILAHLPKEQVDSIIDRHGLPALTDQTITDRAQLEGELEQIRADGYALNLQESIDGIHAVSAPISSQSDETLGAISVAGAAHRLPIEDCKGKLSNAVLAAANEIELDLIYSQEHR